MSNECQSLNCAVKIHMDDVIREKEDRMERRVDDMERRFNDKHSTYSEALAAAEKRLVEKVGGLNNWKEDYKTIVDTKIEPLQRFQDKFIAILALVSLLSGTIGAIIVKILLK